MLTIASLAIAVGLSACGETKTTGSTGETASPTAATASNAARVDGKWKFTATGDVDSKTGKWTVTPACASGPCDFTADSTGGTSREYKLDDSTGKYVYEAADSATCKNDAGKVVAKNAYKQETVSTITVTEAIAASDETLATAMRLAVRVKFTLTSAGEKAGCPKAKSLKVASKLTRTDAPDGEPVKLG